MANENKLMKFPDYTKILKDLNMWIVDNAETCDITFRKSGMNNIRRKKRV